MKKQKLIFILIGVFCVFALATGIYAQFFVEKPNNNTDNPVENIEDNPKTETQEDTKTELNSLFTNELISNNYDTSAIKRKDQSKDIIYSAYDIQKQEANYEINIHLPVINIDGDVPVSFNKITQSIFADKASEILNNKYTERVVYSVDYISFINNNILSLAIKSTLKQGDKPQRVMIQTYNYNLQTGEKVELAKVLSEKGIIQSECKKKIDEVITKAQEEAQVLVNSGYTVYNRDLSNSMYQLSNISTFFLGNDGELYIIFAYGNQNFTSEMDVVLYK